MAAPHRLFPLQSLRFQLLNLVLGAVLLSLSFSIVGALLIAWDLHKSQVSTSLVATARSAAIAVSAAVAFADETAAAEALRVLAPQPEIRAAGVYQLNGERLATYGAAALLPRYASQGDVHGPDISPLSSSASVLLPIVLDDATLGRIYLSADLSAYQRGFLRQSMFAVLASLLGLGLAIWLGVRFIDRISQPVQGLAGLAHRVRESEDFSLRASAPEGSGANNEIAELVDSFNAMLAEIEGRERKIGAYQRDLERMVDDRTSQLAASNAALKAEIRVREQSEAVIRSSQDALRVQKQAAEDANQAKSQFLAAASHDLRQPLHALSLLSSALNERLGVADAAELATDLARVRRLARLIDTSVRNMGSLLNDLLDLSRLQAGAVVPQPASVPLAEVFAHLETRFQPLALDKGLRLRFMPCGQAVRTDALLLDRILANLIANAVRYTERGGILVGTRRRGADMLRIEVVDTGQGIPEAMYGRIFEEYFQLGNPERDREKGQGLGLSIVRRLADLLGIRIAVRSRLGRGTRFSLELPLCDVSQGRADAQGGSQAATAPGPDRLVVLVEDDEAIQIAMHALLEQWGMDLLAVPSVEAAEAVLEESGRLPDLVLSDYRLPGELDGIGVIVRLRARYGADLPGVLITGDTGDEAMRAIARSGLRAMHKPLQPAKLRALLTHLLG